MKEQLKKIRLDAAINILRAYRSELKKGLSTRVAQSNVAKMYDCSPSKVYAIIYDPKYPHGREAKEFVDNEEAKTKSKECQMA